MHALRHAWWFAGCAASSKLTGAAALGLLVLAIALVALVQKRAEIALRFAAAAVVVGGLIVYGGTVAEAEQRERTDRIVTVIASLPVPQTNRQRLRDRSYADAAVCRTESLSFSTPLMGGGAALLVLALRMRRPRRA